MYLDSESAEFAREFLIELAVHDDLFRASRTNVTSLDGAVADVAPDMRYLGDVTREDERQESGADRRTMFRSSLGKDFYVFERATDVWIDVSRLDEGERGSMVYAAILNYAHNTRRTLIGDPAGLSEAAIVRRTSAMLSSALRFGTTRHLAPADEQRTGIAARGIASLVWPGDHAANTTALIDTFLANIHGQFPGIRAYRYDFAGRRFVDGRGRPIGLDRFADAAELEVARASRAGARTLRRAIFMQSLVSSPSSQRPGLLGRVLDWRGPLEPALRALF